MNKFNIKNIKIVGWNAIFVSTLLGIRFLFDKNWEAGAGWLLLSIVLVIFNGVVTYEK